MTRRRATKIYVWSLVTLGLGLWVTSTFHGAPTDLRNPGLLAQGLILLALTFLASISPMETGIGTVTVSLAPLFGAVLILPPWAVMWVASLGTIDDRIPGRRITWQSFFFNRGMWVLTCGVPSLALSALGIPKQTLTWYLSLPIIAMCIILLNIGQVAFYFSLMQGLDVVSTARRMVSGRLPTYIAMPLVGYLIFVILKSQGLLVFLLYGPLLVYRASLQKQNRLDKWLRDSFIMQSRIVDKRDGQTFGHSQRVGELCESVAHLLHLSDEACNTIRVAGILHDLGKIAIPDSILLKPAKLTPEEYEIIKTHPVEGANILAEHPEQKGVAEIVLHHHEKWNGTGYPDGIKGAEIPIGARIVDACDAFDTITQARVFRPTVKTPLEAIRELRQLAGTWYDPAVITALERVAQERWGVEIDVPPQEAAPSYRQLLELRPFRLLLVGQAVSYFGDMMNVTGLAIMLFLITHSPTLVALGLIARAAPTILFGLVAGPIADTMNRQRLMITADLFRAILTVSLPFFAWKWLPGVFISVFLIATASTFFNPAKQAVIPNLVPTKLLVKANGLVSSSEKLMELLGYSMAGVIAAAVSWVPLFLIDAATYLISATTLLGISVGRARLATRRMRLWHDIVEGSRFILGSAPLRSTLGLSFVAAFAIAMPLPLLVVMAYGPLHSGAAGYGVLEAGIGAGAIIGAFAAPSLLSKYRAGALILIGVAGMGLSYGATGFTREIWLAVAFLSLGGVLNMLYYVPLISVTQREALDHVRGRVMSSRFLLVQVGTLLGMAVGGPLSDRVGAPIVFIAAGILLLAASLLGVAFNTLRSATVRDESPARVTAAS